MPVVDDAVRAGQAVYTPLSLAAYDIIVHGLSNRWIWRCPTHLLDRLYDRNVSDRHVDVGVGTGFFLNRAHWPSQAPAITLVDLNAHCLARAAKRVARFAPLSVVANVLEPLPPLAGAPFLSASLCYLLHCLPGTMAEKARVFDHLLPSLEPGAVVFGATIVPGRPREGFAARRLMALYNRRGIFSNLDDRPADLVGELEARFDRVETWQEGTVLLFEAYVRGR